MTAPTPASSGPRPPVTPEELAGRAAAKHAPPLTEEQVQALVRLWWSGLPAPGARTLAPSSERVAS